MELDTENAVKQVGGERGVARLDHFRADERRVAVCAPLFLQPAIIEAFTLEHAFRGRAGHGDAGHRLRDPLQGDVLCMEAESGSAILPGPRLVADAADVDGGASSCVRNRGWSSPRSFAIPVMLPPRTTTRANGIG